MCKSPKENVTLWVRPYFSSDPPWVLFVLLEWFLRWEARGCIAAISWSAACTICSQKHEAFLYSIYLPFSQCVSLESVVHTYISTNTARTTKKSFFVLSKRSDFYMIDSFSIAIHNITIRVLTSISVDEISLLRYVNCSTYFRGLPLIVMMGPSSLEDEIFSFSFE